MIFAIDYDMTCVDSHGETIDMAVFVLQKLVAEKHKLILWTARTEKWLKEAEMWFDKHDIDLFGVMENPEDDYDKDSRKVLCNYYIDDRAACAPLNPDKTLDWQKVYTWLQDIGAIEKDS